jgi:hypothetical protein
VVAICASHQLSHMSAKMAHGVYNRTIIEHFSRANDILLKNVSDINYCRSVILDLVVIRSYLGDMTVT